MGSESPVGGDHPRSRTFTRRRVLMAAVLCVAGGLLCAALIAGYLWLPVVNGDSLAEYRAATSSLRAGDRVLIVDGPIRENLEVGFFPHPIPPPGTPGVVRDAEYLLYEGRATHRRIWVEIDWPGGSRILILPRGVLRRQ